MKTIGLRSLYQLAPTLTEDVYVLHGRRIIGQFTPLHEVGLGGLVHASVEARPMDDTVKKAIEPEQVKQEPGGKLSKGLGDVPGVTDRYGGMTEAWGRSQPVPKPGPKKK